MKKVLLIIVSVAFLLGIGYAGYVVFNSKNIVSIEIDGQVQTLYLVDETDKPNFQDAKLKVNYKSGDAKFIPLEKANITINDFSTETETSKTMKISYKNQLISLDYSVIRGGVYYLSNREVSSLVGGNVSTDETSYKINEVNDLFFFGENGSLKYYVKDSSGKWFLFDGKYKSSYKYEIKDDTMSIYLGGETPSYQIQASKVSDESDNVEVTSTSYTYNGEFQTSKTVYDFTHYDIKTNVEINDLSIYSEDFKTNEDGHNYLEFSKGEKLSNTTKKIYFKIVYSDSLLDVTDSEGNIVRLLNEVYVVADDGMVKNNSLDTSKSFSPILKQAELAYDSELCYVYYTVA